MSALEPVTAAGLGASDPGQLLVRALQARGTALVLLAIAVLQQSLGHHNGDNSWLFSVAERLLEGARPYVDVLETNPPGAFLIYLPAAALAKLLHLSTELVASTLIFSGTLLLLLWVRRLLVHALVLDRNDAPIFLNASVFALLLLPGFSFGEREHLAAICVLPIVAIYVLRAADAPVSLRSALGAGLLAGIAVIAKPHFVLAVALPFGWLLLRRRRLTDVVSPEHWTAVGVSVAYLASLPLAFPHFFDVLPAIVDVYVPVRAPWSIILSAPWFLLNLALIAAILVGMRQQVLPPLAQALLLASGGFLMAYLVQVKGWVNHGLPGVSLAFLAAAVSLAPALRELAGKLPQAGLWQACRLPALFVLLPALLGAPIVFGTIIQFTGWEEYDGLTAAVRRHGPIHPRLATITGELDLGHPLVRRVDGVWAMRPHSLWLMTCALTLLQSTEQTPDMRTRLNDYVARDARQFREDVEQNRPDLIIAESAQVVGPLLRHPDIVAALAAYAPVETVGKLTLYARRD